MNALYHAPLQENQVASESLLKLALYLSLLYLIPLPNIHNLLEGVKVWEPASNITNR
jgi:hypothetical protein